MSKSTIHKVIFDIETANIFSDVGGANDATKL